jgi:hypothetical protein
MKVKIQANELHDADVTQISLVKHGAMRSPWKIIKTEDLPDPDTEQKETGFLASVFKHFAPAPDDVQIAAIYVKGDMDEYVKLLSEAGLVAGHSEPLSDGVTLIKTDAYTDDNLFPLSINEDVILGLTGATELVEKMGEARELFQDQLLALRKNLPQAVHKLDELLNSSFGGSTVAKSKTETNINEVVKMEQIREAAAGDHAGLCDPVAKTETVTAEELAAATAKTTADAVAKTEADDAAVALAAKELAEKDKVTSADVEKTEVEKSAEADAAVATLEEGDKDAEDPLKVIADGLNNLFGIMTGITDRMEKQDKRIEDIAKAAAEEVEKSEQVTKAVDWTMDESLSSMNRTRGDMKKTEEDQNLYGNLFTDITGS